MRYLFFTKRRGRIQGWFLGKDNWTYDKDEAEVLDKEQLDFWITRYPEDDEWCNVVEKVCDT